jgi:hypothetical protein
MHRSTLPRALRLAGGPALALAAFLLHALAGGNALQVAASTRALETASLPTSALPPATRDAAGMLGVTGDRIAVAGCGRTSPEPAAAPTVIALANGIVFDTRDGEPPIPTDLRSPRAPGAGGYYLVQFTGPIEEGWKEDLAAIGGRLHAYIPSYAFLVHLPAGAAARAARLPATGWIGAYHPAYKLSAAPEMAPGRTSDIYTLLVFAGEEVAPVAARIAALGGTVLEQSSGRNRLIRFAAPSNALPELAGEMAVAWIEPWHAPRLDNSSAQWVVQTWVNGSRRIWDQGIRGEGQILSTADSGIRTSHNLFRDAALPITAYGQYPTHRKLLAYVKASTDSRIVFGDASGHGTHTAGTACGDDSPFASDPRDGMALKAQLYFCDGGGTDPIAIYVPVDLNDLLILPYTGNAAGGARIMSNSWSSAAAGNYDFQAMTVDQFTWEHKDFLSFFANGNLAGTGEVGSPATAKNCVAAGGTGNGSNANVFYASTSGGPAEDGRRKPTLCAPAENVASGYFTGDAAYVTFSGTSMATPAMAGATALMRQYVMEGWYPTGTKVPANGFTPSAALLKAMAVNSGDNSVSGHSIPSNTIGWGRVLADNVLHFAGDQRQTALVDHTTGLITGEYVEFAIQVASSAVPLEATLVWTDYPSTPAAARNLVNDLHLTAVEPGGAVYRGNVYAGGQSAAGGAADTLNVEECVQRNTPTTGTWTIRVEAANIPFGPQPFALVVTGGLASGFAVLELDRPTYGANDVIGIQVADANATLPLTASVTSTTETTPETVSLGGGNGLYTGTLAISLAAPAPDGLLQVSDGDTITVTYQDAAPIMARAAVNLSGPVITAVHAGNQSQDGAIITWLTSAPASSQVYYGTSPALGLEAPLDATLVTAHAVTVSGLLPSQTYFFDVESVDSQGNLVRDDLGGPHYTFTTDAQRDVLLVIADDSFDRKDYYESALAARGWSYSVWEGGLAEPPRLGNLEQGLRSFKAVVWQPGFEQYPMISDAARDTLAAFNTGGARWALFSHDVAWDFSDPLSPDYSPARRTWFENELKAIWQADPATWSLVRGVAGDPVSGAYTGGVAYEPHRSGAAGDEINPNSVGGTAVGSWLNNDTSPDDIAIRFTGSGPVGNPAVARWGGQPTRIAAGFFEWAQINAGVPDDPTRADILDKTLIWLVGHDHPDVTVTAPNGGETFLSGPIPITWTEAAAGGHTIASRAIHVSSNGGQSWQLVTSEPGPSPYNWNPAGYPNSARYRIRVQANDDGAPVLGGRDASDADFTLLLPGGDLVGPVVVAGSIAVLPRPVRSTEPAILTATLSEALSGGSAVAAAEWSFGSSPAPAGAGTPMTGAFGAVTVNVQATIPAWTLPVGNLRLWVRGRDAKGSWGHAASLLVPVNGGATGVEEGAAPVLSFALEQNVPNPFNPVTAIRFALPAESEVRLDVFDVAGRLVRTLAGGRLAAGEHAITWDGRDERGRRVASGIYLYRLATPAERAERKMVLLQ